MAVLTGLRRKELRELTWSDLDLSKGTLRVRIDVGKAKREDVIPLHRQAVGELAAAKPANAEPGERVFKTMPTIQTFYKDLERARGSWISEAQNDAEQQSRRKSTFLTKVDGEGRVVDLHAMRTTLGTNLALHGVTRGGRSSLLIPHPPGRWH